MDCVRSTEDLSELPLTNYEAIMMHYFVIQKNTDEIVFEKLFKKYYSKAAEGPNLLLYKKGGIH